MKARRRSTDSNEKAPSFSNAKFWSTTSRLCRNHEDHQYDEPFSDQGDPFVFTGPEDRRGDLQLNKTARLILSVVNISCHLVLESHARGEVQ
jgi:hypothetical protein